MTDTIETYLESLSPEDLARVNRLRGIVRTAGPDLVEDIKWNAPNFSLEGTDCVTLGIERKGGVRMVLHRGARAQSTAGFSFDDPDGLAKWPAPGRTGVSSSCARWRRSKSGRTRLCGWSRAGSTRSARFPTAREEESLPHKPSS